MASGSLPSDVVTFIIFSCLDTMTGGFLVVSERLLRISPPTCENDVWRNRGIALFGPAYRQKTVGEIQAESKARVAKDIKGRQLTARSLFIRATVQTTVQL